MSLLLEALKKAEKAKEEAQLRAREQAAGAPPVEGAAPPAGEPSTGDAPRVRTRDELPDISQPLEIATDDLSPARAPRELTLEAVEPTPARTRGAVAHSETARTQGADRAVAKKVFEAKMREPNPRLPFYIALGVLGAFALGTMTYFWYQLRPLPTLVNVTPVPTQPEQPVSIAANAMQAARPVAEPSASAGSSGIDLLGLPKAPAVPLAPAQPAARRDPPREAPAPRRTRPPASEAPAPRADVKRERSEALKVRRPTPRLDPAVAAGYAAYQAGDLAAARMHYEQALKDEPDNRDALLGVAALDMRAQRYEAAAARYRKLLQADPRDPYALAGMLALRAGQIDPLFAESRVKTLLASDTGTDVLYFTLGNEYARQGRWAEAQQAYFKAFAADADNPDFAYNLAVSLEHIGKPKLALEHYQQALVLAERRAANFDPAAARKRIRELSH